MANQKKTAKKVATKTVPAAGTHKVPKYEQREVASALQQAKLTPKGEK